MNNRTVFHLPDYYWWFQTIGWILYVSVNGLFYYFSDRLNNATLYWLLIILVAGTGLTEIFRKLVIRKNWLRKSIPYVIPRALMSVAAFGSMMTTLQYGYETLLNGNAPEEFQFAKWLLAFLNYTLIFVLWSAIYFLLNSIENYRRTEIEKLQLIALNHETELNRLKSQLNPHFMFNAMNAIRALVDENPARSKEAITHLSGLLRSTLQMGKHRTIPLHQELEIVRDYLALEGARLEERLQVKWEIDKNSESADIPPMMLQTLVENCIKHGISKIPKGGILRITSTCDNERLQIKLENTGQLDPNTVPESGIGIKNTKERLRLLYGTDEGFRLYNKNDSTVITELNLPKKVKYESTDH